MLRKPTLFKSNTGHCTEPVTSGQRIFVCFYNRRDMPADCARVAMPPSASKQVRSLPLAACCLDAACGACRLRECLASSGSRSASSAKVRSDRRADLIHFGLQTASRDFPFAPCARCFVRSKGPSRRV